MQNLCWPLSEPEEAAVGKENTAPCPTAFEKLRTAINWHKMYAFTLTQVEQTVTRVT